MTQASSTMQAYGADTPVPTRHELRAGPLSVVVEGADLRYIRLGTKEIVRRVYVAVRDHNWDTIPQQLRNVQLDANADSFTLSFDVQQRQGAVDFAWRGTVRGDADGVISYLLAGEAQSTFLRNRIGICVLYPASLAGTTATVQHVDGTDEPAAFPELIAPQELRDEQIHPMYPFAELRGVTHAVAPGVQAACTFGGDIWEMEDQRNWTDASYKVYSTPLRLPFPVEVAAGTRIEQQVTLRLTGDASSIGLLADDHATTDELRVVLGTQRAALPALGLGVASHGEVLGHHELAQLRLLRLSHLRVDLELADPSFGERLGQAAEEAAALDAQLDIAVHLGEPSARQLMALAEALRGQQLAIARWLIFHQQEPVTSAATLRLARETLNMPPSGAPIGGGTNAYFTDLNRARPALETLDVVAYSLNPQVHAFDLLSLTETLAAQGTTVTSARAFCGDKPIVVGPVTLRPRFNPNATGPASAGDSDALPPAVDARQLSLYGAGWTLGSIKYLAEAGAASLTYYETTGWRGVLERPAGSPLPAQFPSQAGQLFPLYHIFAALAPFREGQVRYSLSSDPLAVEALALEAEERTRVLLANLSDAPRALTVEGLPSGEARVQLLDQASYGRAAHNEALLATGGTMHQVVDGTLALTLPPFAVACIDPAPQS